MPIHARESFTGPDAVAELSKAVPALLAANKCPDFIEDEGHYFGTDLAEADKRALIELFEDVCKQVNTEYLIINGHDDHRSAEVS